MSEFPFQLVNKTTMTNKATSSARDFTATILSWTLEDIFNPHLFQVEKIPGTFESVPRYLRSFVLPLLEETRAQLHSSMDIISSAPFAEVIGLSECKPLKTSSYDVKVDNWRNRSINLGKEPYKTLPGDIVVLTVAKPETASDLQRVGQSWTLAMVSKIEDEEDNESPSTKFKVMASGEVETSDAKQKSLFVVYLANVTTNKRVWNSMHMGGNLNIIRKVLRPDSMVQENCRLCSTQSKGICDQEFVMNLFSDLNESQRDAVLACLSKRCNHKATVELIWGPPGTGKTKTVSMMLFALLRLKCRTLTCAPTNVAVKEVASRVLKRVKEWHQTESVTGSLFPSFGEILLIGNEESLKLSPGIEDIHFDYRVKMLIECFAPLSGWNHWFMSAIDFFENCASQYLIFPENELIKEQQQNQANRKSFLEFVRERFHAIVLPLKRCIIILCTHIPEDYIEKHNVKRIIDMFGLLDSLETLLFHGDVNSEKLEQLFSHSDFIEGSAKRFSDKLLQLQLSRTKCLSILKSLRSSLMGLKLPSAMSKRTVEEFCFKRASLIFCTASSSYKLYRLEIEPLDFLVIDEAAQLKECESVIPLQLPGIRHAVLIGDECQLPAMVESELSDEAGFGISLFERLSSLGHPKHLLNMQYRMHPFISHFPNSMFYSDKIIDAPNVKNKIYEKRYLRGTMFGPYSFINICGGREAQDDIGHSRRNMVEVAVVVNLVKRLYQVSGAKKKLGIGVISPYAAQVVEIQRRLGKKYENTDGFSVKVKSVDGFQGGEEDIIIISTVRSSKGGAIEFLSNHQRVNVALTRARHCLWILGSEITLSNSESVWESLVSDAKKRQCFFNADDDEELAKAIFDVKKELDQLDDLLHGESLFFKSARWKILFSDYFKKSFGNLASVQKKASVLSMLLKLSSGWRPRKVKVDIACENSPQVLKQFKVEGLYIICSIDIENYEMQYSQVLKVWDVLRLEDIGALVKRLGGIFTMHTDDFIRCCNEKCLEGVLEVPKIWSGSFNIARYKICSNNDTRSFSSVGAADGRCYVENSRVNDSLLLMKFYSLSSGAVKRLLSNHEGGELMLPFEVTAEEREIILLQRSTFILGRSGTGKTTVLTMKLLKREQMYHSAAEGCYGAIANTSMDASRRGAINEGKENLRLCYAVEGAEKTILRQLFVAVSPRLCYAVKRYISQLKSFITGEKYLEESNSVDMDDIAQFNDMLKSFVDVPSKLYPLVVTFYEFLMILDQTVGNSYFERFPDARQSLHGKMGNSRSIAMRTFVKTREVTFDRFCSIYWPHFSEKLTKNLDPSRVFTEIMSHIKGGLQAGESSSGILDRVNYLMLSDARTSCLTTQQRAIMYDIFEAYEKIKIVNGDFDMADLVIDLHNRLKNENYEGDMVDFVYVDEVQDLTMRQIALFKHICKNVSEGFVFSGDTAQTIARGIDFRFEDIRSLFYKEFVSQSRRDGDVGRDGKGQISKICHLSQNFRTHAGVLKLAQSVIDLIYQFFPLNVDILSPETSLVLGEAPVLLESRNDENAFVTIFGSKSKVAGNFVGFGAEQVILVRDDLCRNEIYSYVGKQALVLTIVECKGLEFQDVLLYNFFGSSPLKNKWRLVYEYMKEENLLDTSSPISFPSFNQTKHNLLCSELKQLYVAITRTRQRLWICENIDEFSEPMFDYWKKRTLVEVRKLDATLAQAMQVASGPDEWKSQGYQLLREGNYEMATLCFERAGHEYGVKLAKASRLKAFADRMHGSNPEMSLASYREAAEVYESIDKAENAAECFYILKEYERSGRIYLHCGESALERAGECFYLAGSYELAADVYARGANFSKCISACTSGKLFETGLSYIQYWKRHLTVDRRSQELDQIEQEFLEGCALHYHKLNDNRAMMRFVRSFDSMAAIRSFLKNLGCLEELLTIEEESGNFLEAAGIAKLKGELLLEADLLGKAGHFKDASVLILWFVFANSLWSAESRGWPLKQFDEKEELLSKAKSFSMSESSQFFEFVFMESEILFSQPRSLFMMKENLIAAQRYKSIRGTILSARRILDAHLKVNISKYEWEDEFVLDQAKLSEDRISKNQVSSGTLVYFWNFWKDRIVSILEYLGSLEKQDTSEYSGYGEFCLSYLGVKRQFNNLDPIYFLTNSDAYWVRAVDSRYIRRNGCLISLDGHQFASAALSYWCSELLSVGMDVLSNLEALYNLSIKNSLSLFCQSLSLVHIYEVANFLSQSKFLVCKYRDDKALQNFIGLATKHFFGCIYPLDWRESLKDGMICLRRSEASLGMLKEIIVEYVRLKNQLSYGQLGRISVIVLGSGKLYDELYEKIVERLRWNSSWKALIGVLCQNDGPVILPGTETEAPVELSLMRMLHRALEDAYNANWRKQRDYISPNCFLFLLERQLILLSSLNGYFMTTKSSFLEWVLYQEGNVCQIPRLEDYAPQFTEGILKFLVDIVQTFLYDQSDMIAWIGKSQSINSQDRTHKDHHAVIVLRLVVTLCLLCLNFKRCKNLLFDLLGRTDIIQQLPWEFHPVFQSGRMPNSLKVDVHDLAKALSKIGNPLVIVNLGKISSSFSCPDAIFLDMSVRQNKDDLLRIMFPKINEATQDDASSSSGTIYAGLDNARNVSMLPSSNAGSMEDWNSNIQKAKEVGLPFCLGGLWETFKASESVNRGEDKILAVCDPKVKVDVQKIIHFIDAAVDECFQKNLIDDNNRGLFVESVGMLNELKQLYTAVNVSEPKGEKCISTIGELCMRLLSRRQRMEPFLNQIYLKQDDNLLKWEALETSIAPNCKCDKEVEGRSRASHAAQDGSQSTENKGKNNATLAAF